MKQKNLIILTIILLFSVLNSCKKGEDDPFFSLLSRKQRLAGKWTLKSADYTQTKKTPIDMYPYVYHYIYDGSKYAKATIYNGTTKSITEYNYSEKMEFKKNGTFTKNYTNDGDNFTEEGIWTWIRKNKEIGLKNKEAILLTLTKVIEADGTVTYSGVSNYPNDMMIFKKLTNKEFVIHFDYSYPNEYGKIASFIGTMTYTQD